MNVRNFYYHFLPLVRRLTLEDPWLNHSTCRLHVMCANNVLHQIYLRTPNTLSTGLKLKPMFCNSMKYWYCHERKMQSNISGNVVEEGTEIEDSLLNWNGFDRTFMTKERKPGEPHRIFVLQPYVKWGPRKVLHTNAELQLEESISLVRTLKWTIVDSAIYSTTSPGKKRVFGKGSFSNLTERIAENPALTAVFVSLDRLTSLQQKELEDVWNVDVFDRYTLVLEIFKQHARTKEAKLQIALAEIPVLRSRIRMKDKNFDQQSGSQQYIGGGGETFLEVRQRVLAEREVKIKKALKKLKNKRHLLRKDRESKQFPVVSVVGYTNAGKTSLIKTITGDSDLHPRNELFATLDVTAHRGTLANGMTVIFMDTVGFISNLPHELVASFAATLEDVLLSDVIVHVRDISHPDTVAQKINVLRVLRELGLSEKLMENIIEVCNKSDLLTDDFIPEVGNHVISATKGTGVEELKLAIQQKALEVTDTVACTLKIPMSGGHLSWLYKEANVQQQRSLEGDSENMLVDVVMSARTQAKFRARFGSELVVKDSS